MQVYAEMVLSPSVGPGPSNVTPNVLFSNFFAIFLSKEEHIKTLFYVTLGAATKPQAESRNPSWYHNNIGDTRISVTVKCAFHYTHSVERLILNMFAFLFAISANLDCYSVAYEARSGWKTLNLIFLL